jgi:hypothetical protein
MIKGIRPIDGIFRSNTITPLRSGYQSFEWGLASDHRLLWIDIDMHNVLGTTTAPLWKPAARRLKFSNPILIQKFNKLRTKAFEKLQGPTLLKKLKDPTLYNTFQQWQDDFEQLDNLRLQSIREADKRCRKLKMGQVPWSPTIQTHMTNISYLQRCRMKYINGHDIN